ncbi:hypothetical protein FPQ18DRAFT_304497 [Pyronema domesticum]|nr:hypothetical protein FPQ18DRAFT_304497 [Pyronema domesticum]
MANHTATFHGTLLLEDEGKSNYRGRMKTFEVDIQCEEEYEILGVDTSPIPAVYSKYTPDYEDGMFEGAIMAAHAAVAMRNGVLDLPSFLSSRNGGLSYDEHRAIVGADSIPRKTMELRSRRMKEKKKLRKHYIKMIQEKIERREEVKDNIEAVE